MRNKENYELFATELKKPKPKPKPKKKAVFAKEIEQIRSGAVTTANKNGEIICWWSGGVTSAVACLIAVTIFENVRVIFIDTKNEDEDTYRFLKDCEKWYGKEIEIITGLDGDKYTTIDDVWDKYKTLNVAHGAVCSSELKKVVRETWQKENPNSWSHQIFGFEDEKKEINRAVSMTLNHPSLSSRFPLIEKGLTKKDCIKILKDQFIEIPNAYKTGFQNNNCLKTGCVQGGIGYWQKMQAERPDTFKAMAEREHRYSRIKKYEFLIKEASQFSFSEKWSVSKFSNKQAVTMLRDQTKANKGKPIFLLPNPDFPDSLDLSTKEGKPVVSLADCSGFCSLNDLNPVVDDSELNRIEVFQLVS